MIHLEEIIRFEEWIKKLRSTKIGNPGKTACLPSGTGVLFCRDVLPGFPIY